MNRRSFLSNSIGVLLFGAISSNKVLANIVDIIPNNSLDVLIYAVKSKSGDWKIKATKWTNLNKDKLRTTEFNIDTFTPLGIFDNSEIKEKQRSYSKQYNAVRSLHSVDHYQCTINGKNYCVSKQATSKSRSKGGITRRIENKESGYWNDITKKYSSENGKKNIIHTQTKYSRLAQKNSATYIFEQYKDDGTIVKNWKGKVSFINSIYNFNSVRKHCDFGTQYKGYYWRIKKKTNKIHRKSEWNNIKIKDSAKECSYKAEFRRKYQQAFYMAKRLGIFDEVTAHMKRPKAKNQYTK